MYDFAPIEILHRFESAKAGNAGPPPKISPEHGPISTVRPGGARMLDALVSRGVDMLKHDHQLNRALGA